MHFIASLSHIAAISQRHSHNLAIGYGSFGYEPNVEYLFGVPRYIEAGGAAMNIRIARFIGTHTNDPEHKKQLNMQTGILSSALEHAVPEQMFTTDPANPADAVSAVKALQKATQAGQRIYHITPANHATALQNINHHPDTMAEISAALQVGKEVITHTDSISVPGWNGAGYIILDPTTGDGSYKIGGGQNGGYLLMFGFALGFVALIGLALGASAFFLVSIALVALTASLINFFLTAETCGNAVDDVNVAINVSIAGFAAIFSLLGKVAATITSAITSWVYGTGASSAINNFCT